MKYIIGIIVVIVLTIILFHLPMQVQAPLETATTTGVTTTTPQPAPTSTLALGQQGQIGAFGIRPIKVEEDSRCPKGVMCIQAGRLRVSVEMTYQGAGTTLVLELGKPMDYRGTQITLTSSDPLKGTTQIQPSEYRFTFTLGS